MDSKRKYSLAVIILTKNEENNLKKTIKPLKGWATELIVYDSGSTDKTEAIANSAGAHFIQDLDWQGFGKQRIKAQTKTSCDWILMLDADEELTEEVKQSIDIATQNAPSDTVYAMRRIDYIFGKPIDTPKWIIPIKGHYRLYGNEQFSYCESLVHESLQCKNATIKTLKGFTQHHTADTPEFWLEKRHKYAIAWAENSHSQGKTTSIWSCISHGVGAFIKQYFIYGRFLMSSQGLYYSILFANYTFNKYAILLNLNEQQSTDIK